MRNRRIFSSRRPAVGGCERLIDREGILLRPKSRASFKGGFRRPTLGPPGSVLVNRHGLGAPRFGGTASSRGPLPDTPLRCRYILRPAGSETGSGTCRRRGFPRRGLPFRIRARPAHKQAVHRTNGGFRYRSSPHLPLTFALECLNNIYGG
jgi:hypothetical protein